MKHRANDAGIDGVARPCAGLTQHQCLCFFCRVRDHRRRGEGRIALLSPFPRAKDGLQSLFAPPDVSRVGPFIHVVIRPARTDVALEVENGRVGVVPARGPYEGKTRRGIHPGDEQVPHHVDMRAGSPIQHLTVRFCFDANDTYPNFKSCGSASTHGVHSPAASCPQNL